MIKQTFFQLKLNIKETCSTPYKNTKIIKILVHHFPYSDVPGFLQKFVYTMSCDGVMKGESGNVQNYFYESFRKIDKNIKGKKNTRKKNRKKIYIYNYFNWEYRDIYRYGQLYNHWRSVL